MILTSQQRQLVDGRQEISFNVTSSPSSALVSWETGSMVLPVSLEGEFYYIRSLIPAQEFTVKLDSEPRVLSYEGEWGDGVVSDSILLETEGINLLVPHCDLGSLDIRLYTSTMVPLEIWGYWRKKAWILSQIYVTQAYGGRTLIDRLRLEPNIDVKERAGNNWTTLGDLPGGFYIEVFNVQRVTTNPAVNATICRDSLYGKTYARMVEEWIW